MPEKKRSSRILTFDLMRGYFLLVILINHLDFYPNGLTALTGESALYASTAEGFFVISGIVLGIVRGRKLINLPFLVGAKLLWKRALQLYITSVVLTILFTVIGQFFLDNHGLKYGIYTDWAHPLEFLWRTFALSYVYGWADFLKLYAIFLFFTPFALWLLRRGLWYVVSAVSIIVWALYPFLPQDTTISLPFSWQLVFFGGFVIGFYWEVIIAKWRALPLQRRKLIGWTFVSTFIITVAISFMLVFGHRLGGPIGGALDFMHHAIENNFNKDQLPLPRLLLGIIWFWGMFYLFRRFEGWIVARIGWLLLPFGENSLYTYTISAFVIFITHLLINPPGFQSLIPNLLVTLGATSLVYLCVKKKFLMKIIPR